MCYKLAHSPQNKTAIDKFPLDCPGVWSPTNAFFLQWHSTAISPTFILPQFPHSCTIHFTLGYSPVSKATTRKVLRASVNTVQWNDIVGRPMQVNNWLVTWSHVHQNSYYTWITYHERHLPFKITPHQTQHTCTPSLYVATSSVTQHVQGTHCQIHQTDVVRFLRIVLHKTYHAGLELGPGLWGGMGLVQLDYSRGLRLRDE